MLGINNVSLVHCIISSSTYLFVSTPFQFLLFFFFCLWLFFIYDFFELYLFIIICLSFIFFSFFLLDICYIEV